MHVGSEGFGAFLDVYLCLARLFYDGHVAAGEHAQECVSGEAFSADALQVSLGELSQPAHRGGAEFGGGFEAIEGECGMQAAFGGGCLDSQAVAEEGELQSDAGVLLLGGVAGADAVFVDTIAQQHFGHIGEAPACAGFDPERVIFDVARAGLIAQAGGGVGESKNFAAHHDGGMAEGIAKHESAFHRSGIGGIAQEAAALSGGIDLFEPSAEDADSGMFLEESDLPGQALGHHHIIGVHAREVASAGAGEQAVERRHDAGIGLADDAEAAIFACQRLEPFAAAIGRAIITGQQLPLHTLLCEDTCDRIA